MNFPMKKTSKIATIAAALLLSLGLLTSSPARAAEASNGFLTTNGFSMNGFSMNGFSMNGFSMNGFSMNGFSMNGFSMNGWSMNGLSPRAGRVSMEAIWASDGIDPHEPLATTVARVGR
jgi:hypothetical protein